MAVTLNFENSSLVFEESKLLDIEAGPEVYSSITIPVQGDPYSTISNATFLLHDNQIVTYTETLLTKSEDNKFVIDIYFDGRLLESNHTGITFINNSEIQRGLDTIQKNSGKEIQYPQTRGGADVAAAVGCFSL